MRNNQNLSETARLEETDYNWKEAMLEGVESVFTLRCTEDIIAF